MEGFHGDYIPATRRDTYDNNWVQVARNGWGSGDGSRNVWNHSRLPNSSTVLICGFGVGHSRLIIGIRVICRLSSGFFLTQSSAPNSLIFLGKITYPKSSIIVPAADLNPLTKITHKVWQFCKLVRYFYKHSRQSKGVKTNLPLSIGSFSSMPGGPEAFT